MLQQRLVLSTFQNNLYVYNIRSFMIIYNYLQYQFCRLSVQHPRKSEKTRARRCRRRCRRQGHKRLRMRRRCRPISAIPRPNLDGAFRNVPAKQCSVEQLQGGLGLVIRDFMASLVNPGEREVSVFAGFAILNTINQEAGVAGLLELLGMRVLQGEGDGLATEPVADVVCIPVDEGNADWVCEDFFEVLDEVGPDEVAGLLEGVVDFVVRGSIINAYAEGFHNPVLAEEGLEKSGGCWILFHPRVSINYLCRGQEKAMGSYIVRVANVVNAAAAKVVVGSLCRLLVELQTPACGTC